MEMRNCPRCGRVFNYVSAAICPSCEKDEERIFNTVKDYINDNPHSKMSDVITATGVSAKRIMKYIKDGRLETSKGMDGEITCEQCGKPIVKGRFCDSCVIKINQNVAEVFSAQKKPEAKMHISNKGRTK